ncbi:conserved hypothetical protein [Leishmania mexicana MHOM/GT/2001/U1103]|uniref:Uncharacterized protein n=1 Tax=Leishmania mexicana (strain MHOM/GT/2001/U1103) TaxID=929439 RepID=E9AWD6_LEIMU|nr:conserved hypothetical protein [Leishmania mexicana MHOM/GT/2001/U1103]CBZ27271.1 conserved hypothetical protein [Leishmania mexicana MHOM/GT/2001/U1103]
MPRVYVSLWTPEPFHDLCHASGCAAVGRDEPAAEALQPRDDAVFLVRRPKYMATQAVNLSDSVVFFLLCEVDVSVGSIVVNSLAFVITVLMSVFCARVCCARGPLQGAFWWWWGLCCPLLQRALRVGPLGRLRPVIRCPRC